MLANIIIGLMTMTVCLILQSVMLVITVHYYNKYEYLLSNHHYSSTMIVLTMVMFMLILGNLFQISIWATLFILLGEFSHFSESFYHSTVNFATLGYGDVVMSEEHKLLGGLEAVNGILMIGVTTAMLIEAFREAIVKTMKARKDFEKPQG